MSKQEELTEEPTATHSSSHTAPSKQQTKSATRRRMTTIILTGLLVVMICVSALLFVKYRHAANNNPVSQQQQLLNELSQVAEVPAEQPAISTVLNSSKLTNRTLAKHARNGDKLFIFPKSKRIILYRPSDHKVVDMLTIQS